VDIVAALSRIIPFAFASGINLYATVALLGLCSRYDLVVLPDQFRAFESPLVIGIALAMYAVEFVADKVPWFDSVWDAVHTVIRPLGGAFVAVTSLGAASPEADVLAALLGGSVAFTAHLSKSGTRAAANTSPEPFSNWILSLGEDVFVVSLIYLALQYPVAATIIVLTLVIVILAFATLLIRALRRRFGRRTAAA
jgi:nicotinamide riboside transporter PnuC